MEDRKEGNEGFTDANLASIVCGSLGRSEVVLFGVEGISAAL